MRQMKDTKVSVVQAHRDAHAPESAGLYAGCGSGNIELRRPQKNDFSESAQLRGQVFFVHFLESCSKNFPSTNISPPAGAVARKLRTHPRAFTAPHGLNVRDIVLGNQMRKGDGENADAAHALPGL